MAASVSFNPQITTVTQGLFNVQSDGIVQGAAYPDPAIVFKLASGTLSVNETLPMWGGVGIYTDVPKANPGAGPDKRLNTIVGRATTLANLVGFSVFDQAFGMLNTPQSPVPLAASYMQVMYYRLGSGARIGVAADAAVVALQGGLTTAQVSWDFVNQMLIPFVPAWTQQNVSSATYVSSTGLLSVTFASAPLGASAADLYDGRFMSLSGITGGAVNGNWPLSTTTTSGTVLVFQITKLLGSLTLSGGVLAAGGGALPCQLLDVQSVNCQIVSYNTGTGFATWNFNGCAAIILI